MQKALSLFMAVAGIVWPLAGQATQSSAPPPHRQTTAKAKSKAKSSAKASSSAKSSTVSKSSAAPRASVKTAGTKGKSKTQAKTVRNPVRSYQQAPTTERYQEIQQALSKKGYFHGEANGEWGADSLDALKRFQADQNLMPTGKINSLSLIALGLGPKRLTAQSKPAPAAPAATPAPPTPGPQ